MLPGRQVAAANPTGRPGRPRRSPRAPRDVSRRASPAPPGARRSRRRQPRTFHLDSSAAEAAATAAAAAAAGGGGRGGWWGGEGFLEAHGDEVEEAEGLERLEVVETRLGVQPHRLPHLALHRPPPCRVRASVRARERACVRASARVCERASERACIPAPSSTPLPSCRSACCHTAPAGSGMPARWRVPPLRAWARRRGGAISGANLQDAVVAAAGHGLQYAERLLWDARLPQHAQSPARYGYSFDPKEMQ